MKKLLSIALLNLFAVGASHAAQIQVNYGLQSTAVPSLNGWMLVVLALLLGSVAYRMLKQGQHGTNLMLGVIGVSALLSASSGIKVLSDAQAGGNIIITNTNGSVTIGAPDTDAGFIFIQNDAGSSIDISSITSPDNSCPDIAMTSSLFGTQPHCLGGMSLLDDDICYILCDHNNLQAP